MYVGARGARFPWFSLSTPLEENYSSIGSKIVGFIGQLIILRKRVIVMSKRGLWKEE